MNIYESNTLNFENNGLGYLTDVLSAYVTESLDNDYLLTIEYPVVGRNSEYLIKENIIKANVGNNNFQLFRIKYLEKNFKTIKITAYHITYDLNENLVEDCVPTDLTSQDFGNYILNHTASSNSFSFESILSGKKTARYVRKNPIECFVGNLDNSMIKLFGGELERDNFKLKLVSRRGVDNNVKLIFGKNIKEINLTTDITNLYTRIMPLGKDGLKLPEKYVDSPLINNYPSPKICVVKFDDIEYSTDAMNENAYHDLESAYQALRDAVNNLYDAGQDKPLINIKINWLELSKTKEYHDKYAYLERVSLGDTIHAEVLNYIYETRVIKTTYNVLNDTIETFEVGNFKSSFQDTLNTMNSELKGIDPSSIVEDAVSRSTKLISSAMGGYVYKTQNELFIMDTDNPNTATKVWRWNINGLGYSSTGINGPYGLAMTMNGEIVADFITAGKLNTEVIEGYDMLVLKVNNFDSQAQNISKIQVQLEEIQQQIGSITDITTSSSGTNNVVLTNVLESELLFLQIHPTSTDIKYLYPSNILYPSDNLFMSTRDVLFTSNDSIKTFTIPSDLLFLSDSIYDEFILSYDTSEMYVIHRVGFDSEGNKVALENEQIEYFQYRPIYLSAGNYSVKLDSFTDAFISVRALASNIYTSQYATKIELNSAINLTKETINLSVDQKITLINNDVQSMNAQITLQADKINLKLDSSDFNSAAIIGLINNRDGTSTAKIKADNIELEGYVTITDLTGEGTTTINGSNIKTGTLNADKISGGLISTSGIDIYNGVGFLRALYTGSAHPYVSALNVATQGSITGGISFRNSNSRTGLGSEKASLAYSTNEKRFLIESIDQLSIHGQATTSVLSTGNLNIEGKTNVRYDSGGYFKIVAGYANQPASNSGSLYLNAQESVNLNAKNGGVYAGAGINSSNTRVKTTGGDVSSRNAKANIKLFDGEYERALKLLDKMNLYSYDYKYNLYKDPHQYGFIIEELEKLDKDHEFFKLYDEKAIVHGKSLDFNLDNKTKKDKVIKLKRYDTDALDKYLLTICKAMLQKINKIEEELWKNH